MKRDKTKMSRLVADVGRCEFCGSTRGLEAHHIVPIVCGGDNSDENLIVCCVKCHAILTPRSILTKAGIENARKETEYEKLRRLFFKRVNDEEPTTASECIEIFNDVMTGLLSV